jgi:hypothetical protein
MAFGTQNTRCGATPARIAASRRTWETTITESCRRSVLRSSHSKKRTFASCAVQPRSVATDGVAPSHAASTSALYPVAQTTSGR